MPIIFSTIPTLIPVSRPDATRVFFQAPDDALLAAVVAEVASILGRHQAYVFHEPSEVPAGRTPVVLNLGPGRGDNPPLRQPISLEHVQSLRNATDKPLAAYCQAPIDAGGAHTLRASHGQAPAWATKPTEQQILEAAFAPAQPAAQQGAAYAALPDAPLSVFSKGPWVFKETGQDFSGAELDEAAFVAYREHASRGQAPAVKREFTNELGNSIRITVEGPNSMHENIVTPMEAKQLREALNEHAQKSAPAGATLVHLDHIACIDGGELRYITGRKAPAYDCELYAMPNGGSAPQLYAAPTTQAAPQQEVPDNRHRCRLLTRAELARLCAKAEGMDGNQWDMWVQEQFARANRLKIEGSNYDWE